MNTFSAKRALLAAALAGSVSLSAFPAMAQDETIKVGILHSLSGTMAISDTPRAACSANSLSPSWSTLLPTGRWPPNSPVS
jgi:hypothetical protein